MKSRCSAIKRNQRRWGRLHSAEVERRGQCFEEAWGGIKAPELWYCFQRRIRRGSEKISFLKNKLWTLFKAALWNGEVKCQIHESSIIKWIKIDTVKINDKQRNERVCVCTVFDLYKSIFIFIPFFFLYPESLVTLSLSTTQSLINGKS